MSQCQCDVNFNVWIKISQVEYNHAGVYRALTTC